MPTCWRSSRAKRARDGDGARRDWGERPGSEGQSHLASPFSGLMAAAPAGSERQTLLEELADEGVLAGDEIVKGSVEDETAFVEHEEGGLLIDLVLR